MSPYERWRNFRIVDPLNINREEELVGGLKNALDRGEPLAKAKQSFLNAGYKPAEIEGAIKKIPTAASQINNQVKDSRGNRSQNTKIKTKKGVSSLPKAVKEKSPKQKLSKKFIIILIASATLVLIGVALLGIFWNKLF